MHSLDAVKREMFDFSFKNKNPYATYMGHISMRGYYCEYMAKANQTVVAAYSLKGKLVKTYSSATEASRIRHVYKRTIDRATRGDILTVKRLQWRRVSKDDIPQFIEPLKKIKATNTKKKVGKLSETGEIVEIYPSLSSAAKSNNIDPHTLRDRLNHKYQNKGKTQFVYIEE